MSLPNPRQRQRRILRINKRLYSLIRIDKPYRRLLDVQEIQEQRSNMRAVGDDGSWISIVRTERAVVVLAEVGIRISVSCGEDDVVNASENRSVDEFNFAVRDVVD